MINIAKMSKNMSQQTTANEVRISSRSSKALEVFCINQNLQYRRVEKLIWTAKTQPKKTAKWMSVT